MEDYLGNKIEIGDYCTVIMGSGKVRGTLTLCKVIRLFQNKYDDTKITAVRIESFGRKSEIKKWNLFDSDRVFKMNESQVPEDIKEQLKDYGVKPKPAKVLEDVKPGDYLVHDITGYTVQVDKIVDGNRYVLAYRKVNKHKIRILDGADVTYPGIGGFWTPKEGQ